MQDASVLRLQGGVMQGTDVLLAIHRPIYAG